MANDLIKIPQAWVVPDQMHYVMARVVQYMMGTAPRGIRPSGAPEIPEMTVCDDRGGSGHFWIRFEYGVTLAQARKIVGKETDVTMEHL